MYIYIYIYIHTHIAYVRLGEDGCLLAEWRICDIVDNLRVCVHVCMYACMYAIYVYIYIYIYIYIHTHKLQAYYV